MPVSARGRAIAIVVIVIVSSRYLRDWEDRRKNCTGEMIVLNSCNQRDEMVVARKQIDLNHTPFRRI